MRASPERWQLAFGYFQSARVCDLLTLLSSHFCPALSPRCRFLEVQKPRLCKMLRVLAFAYPYTWDSLPIFYRVRAPLCPLRLLATVGSQVFPESLGVRAPRRSPQDTRERSPGASLLAPAEWLGDDTTQRPGGTTGAVPATGAGCRRGLRGNPGQGAGQGRQPGA